MSSSGKRLAVAYVRVSTDEQQLSPEAQRAAVESWAAAQALTVVELHVDTLSGATPIDERPGLLAALTALRRHRAGLLLAAKRDRFARDVELAAELEARVRRAGAMLATADGTSDTSSSGGQLLRRMVDVFAEHERALIRERTRAALEQKRQRGERISGHAPYGWRHEAGRLVEDAEEQTTLRLLLEALAGGASLQAAAAALRRAGRRSRTPSGVWHKTTIARLSRRHLRGHAS